MVEPNNPNKQDWAIPNLDDVLDFTWVDNDARKEAQQWSELDKVKLNNDVRWLSVYGYILIGVTIALAIIFVAAIGVWAFHYLTCWTWLTDSQLEKVQSILFSGGMGAVVANIIRTQISKAQ